jgi:biopolymer transport protein ExbD
MAIYRPGERFRYHNILSRRKKGRSVVALLSLTAMVDMFTVLVVFLLQNFSTPNVLIYIPPHVELPKAESTKDLQPAFVVTISKNEIYLDKEVIAKNSDVQSQEDWLIKPLHEGLISGLAASKAQYEQNLRNRIRNVVDSAKGQEIEDEELNWNKVTIQSDKNIDFLTVKKVMYTITEAGAGEINFAVTKELSSSGQSMKQ